MTKQIAFPGMPERPRCGLEEVAAKPKPAALTQIFQTRDPWSVPVPEPSNGTDNDRQT